MTCNCYAQFLSEVARFGLRYGAHNPTCPTYRESLDPVDRAYDTEYRARMEQGAWNRAYERR